MDGSVRVVRRYMKMVAATISGSGMTPTAWAAAGFAEHGCQHGSPPSEGVSARRGCQVVVGRQDDGHVGRRWRCIPRMVLRREG